MLRFCAHILAVTMVVVFTAGCGFEAGESPFDDQTVDVNGDDNIQPGNGELGEGSGAGSVAGTWLKVHVASSCVLGQEQLSAAYYLVDIEADETVLEESRRLCELNLSPLLGSRPVASREVLDSVVFPSVDQGLVSSHASGGAYGSSTAVGLWGLDLDDPLEDPVPTDGDDDTVIDADDDGNPGVTMWLEGADCDRYMGQRQVVKFYGTLEAANDIRGSSVRTTETEVYGGTASTCEMAPDVESNDDESFFRMVRVDGQGGAVDAADGADSIGCEDVEPYYEELWEIREPDDAHCE